MGTKKLIKRFDFTSKIRSKLEFSDRTKIRLNDDNKLDQGLTLKSSGGAFDTGLGNTVLTPTTEPKKLRRWIGFEAEQETPENTSVGYRLITEGGTKELYWDGATWSEATTDAHWNTFKEVNTNIKALTPVGFDLAVKVNLRSSDGKNTPKVRGIKFLVKVFFEPWDDLIYDTVVGSMRDSLRATTAIQFAVAETTSTIDLSSTYKLENSGYNFVDVEAAFNLTDDPNQFNDIASSYTKGPQRNDGTFEDGQINLSQQVNAGDIVRLEMRYEPEIAVFTNQEYVEPERLPAIVFERIASVRPNAGTDQERNNRQGDFVRDFNNDVATQVPTPRQSTVLFEYAIWANPLDIGRLTDAIDKWIGDNRILRTWAFDEEINVDPMQEAETGNSTNLDDIVLANGMFQLKGVPFHTRDAKEVPLVLTVNQTFKQF